MTLSLSQVEAFERSYQEEGIRFIYERLPALIADWRAMREALEKIESILSDYRNDTGMPDSGAALAIARAVLGEKK